MLDYDGSMILDALTVVWERNISKKGSICRSTHRTGDLKYNLIVYFAFSWKIFDFRSLVSIWWTGSPRTKAFIIATNNQKGRVVCQAYDDDENDHDDDDDDDDDGGGGGGGDHDDHDDDDDDGDDDDDENDAAAAAADADADDDDDADADDDEDDDDDDADDADDAGDDDDDAAAADDEDDDDGVAAAAAAADDDDDDDIINIWIHRVKENQVLIHVGQKLNKTKQNR